MKKLSLAPAAIAVLLFFGSPALASASNLLANPGAETGDFTGWTATAGPGIGPGGHDDGWGIINDSSYAHSGNDSFISSYGCTSSGSGCGFDTLSQEIDLSAAGYSGSYMDTQPEIDIGTYVRGYDAGSGSNDPYDVKVILRDASHNPIATYDTGTQTATNNWVQVAHTFTGYGFGVRYIYFEQDGRSSAWWSGQYGSTFDDASVVVAPQPAVAAAPATSHHNFVIVNPTAASGSSALDFTLNGGATSTASPTVAIGFDADPRTVTGYAISLDPTFANGGIEPYTSSTTAANFQLPSNPGTDTVYLEYFSSTGNRSSVISHTITYNPTAAVAATLTAQSTSANLVNPFTASLALGTQGPEVSALQQLLVKDGELTLPAGASYGYFGSTTKQALEAFQVKYSIIVAGAPGYGIFGPKTRTEAGAILQGK